MRAKLYKIALFLVIISFLPFLIFISRKENPPEKVKIPHHKTQAIENFKLEATGKNRWELVAPEATFAGKEIINLRNPVLTLYLKDKLMIKATKAILYRDKGIVYLENVRLLGKNFEAVSNRGTYNLKEQIFETRSGCRATYNMVNTSEGKVCKIDLKEDRVTILNRVKTIVREVKK